MLTPRCQESPRHVKRLVELMPLALPRESVAPPSRGAVSRCCTVWTWLAIALEHEAPLPRWFWRNLQGTRASRPLIQHNAQSRHAPHFSLCCSSAVQVLSQTRHGSRLQCTALWTFESLYKHSKRPQSSLRSPGGTTERGDRSTDRPTNQ